MKIKVSTTIPTSRSYENLKIEYEGEIAERQAMINMAREDLEKYNGLMKRPEGTPSFMFAPHEGDKCLMGDNEFFFKDGKWNFREINKKEKVILNGEGYEEK